MQDLRLRSIEREHWTSRQQDGLFDIYFGLLMLAIAVSALVEALGAPDPWRLVTLVVLQFSSAGAYALAKRRFVTSRLGAVKFGVMRVRRSRRLALILAVCVSATAALVALTAVGGSPLGLLSRLGRFALPTVIALLVGIPLTAIAILLQFTRILLHAAFFVITGFGLAASGRSFMDPIAGAIAFGACGSASMIVGFVYFRRFLRHRAPTAGGES